MALTKAPEELVDKSLTSTLTVTTADNSNNLVLASTDADSNAGPILDFYRNSASPAVGDLLGRINFRGRNDNSQDVDYAAWHGRIFDETDGTEDGSLRADIMYNGTVYDVFTLYGNEVVVNESSNDIDFRVESNGSANMLFVDGGNDEVVVQRASSGATATAGSVLIVEDDDNAEISILGGSSSVLALNFGHSGDPDDAIISYNTTSGSEAMAFTVNAAERMRIKSDGTVGIGDNDPSTYLTIKYSSSSQEHGVTVRNLQSGGYGAAFTVKSTGDSEQIAARFLVQGENNWGDASSQDSTIYLQTLSDNSLDGRIRIYSSGYTAVKGHMTPWTDNTYDLGQSSYRWDDVYATNSTIQTSDKNLKDNITESDLGLSFIKELKPVSYKWKDKTRTHYGLIAQDVKETLDSISKSTTNFAGYIENKQYTLGDGDDPLTSDKRPTESEDTILGLRYQEFIAPLIKAVQEQQTLIETLEAKVKALEEA
jgi:prepilin-type processing-associated H-X9-DG protein